MQLHDILQLRTSVILAGISDGGLVPPLILACFSPPIEVESSPIDIGSLKLIRRTLMHSLFEIQHLSYAYHTMQGETAALSDITFTVNSGDFVAIVGPSGCGKSTLLNLLAGMLTPESGTLLLNGTPLTADSRRHIGYMLQQDYLLEWRSIWKNVLLGLEIRHEVTEESRAYAKQLLKQYGLEKFSQSKPKSALRRHAATRGSGPHPRIKTGICCS